MSFCMSHLKEKRLLDDVKAFIMESGLKEQLQPIFPQIDSGIIERFIGDTIGNLGENSENILPVCIDLLLEYNAVQRSPNANNNTATQWSADEDVICLGSKLKSPKPTPPVIQIPDTESEGTPSVSDRKKSNTATTTPSSSSDWASSSSTESLPSTDPNNKNRKRRRSRSRKSKSRSIFKGTVFSLNDQDLEPDSSSTKKAHLSTPLMPASGETFAFVNNSPNAESRQNNGETSAQSYKAKVEDQSNLNTDDTEPLGSGFCSSPSSDYTEPWSGEHRKTDKLGGRFPADKPRYETHKAPSADGTFNGMEDAAKAPNQNGTSTRSTAIAEFVGELFKVQPAVAQATTQLNNTVNGLEKDEQKAETLPQHRGDDILAPSLPGYEKEGGYETPAKAEQDTTMVAVTHVPEGSGTAEASTRGVFELEQKAPVSADGAVAGSAGRVYQSEDILGALVTADGAVIMPDIDITGRDGDGIPDIATADRDGIPDIDIAGRDFYAVFNDAPEQVNYAADNIPQQAVPNVDHTVQFVTQMFPTVKVNVVEKLILEGKSVDDIVTHVMQNPDVRPVDEHKTESPPKAKAADIDYYKEYSGRVSQLYEDQCNTLLRNEFRWMYANDIRSVMLAFRNHYAASKKFIEEKVSADNQAYKSKSTSKQAASPTASATGGQPSATSTSTSTGKGSAIKHDDAYWLHKRYHNRPFPRLCSSRLVMNIYYDLEEELAKEVAFDKKQKALKMENENWLVAQHLNEEEYKEAGQLIECGCCFGEFPFEEIVQCSDAHLFCSSCLKSYAKEVIFGSAISKAKLNCMTDGCTKPFPYSQLRKVLSEEEIVKYQERLQEECLISAEIPNLHKCPYCEFQAIATNVYNKVFTCLKPTCQKVTCKECKEDWKDHVGLKCSEVEKKTHVNLRVSYEERMTNAKIRTCLKCSCAFTKSAGCNKMTCRCGTTMCYVCRESKINYQHFCPHPRDPGKKCAKCAACSLWSDPKEDDELAVKQLEEEAKAEKRKLDDLINMESVKRQKISV